MRDSWVAAIDGKEGMVVLRIVGTVAESGLATSAFRDLSDRKGSIKW